jgi:hypothetical protein
MAKPLATKISSQFGKSAVILALVTVASLGLSTSANALQARVTLGEAKSYVVLAGAGITNTGPTTASGNAGANFGSSPTGSFTGDTDVTTTGTKFTSVVAQTTRAKSDLVRAYNDAAGRTPFTVVSNLGGNTYTTGVYQSASTIALTGTVTLDAEDNPDAVFFFLAGSSLITESGSVVALINGAQACNVYWQVGSSATFRTTSDFSGHVFALTSITAETGATFNGQLLARNGTVTLDTNTFVNDECIDSGSGGGGSRGNSSGGSDGNVSTEGLALTGENELAMPLVLGFGATAVMTAIYVIRRRRRA